MPASDATLVLGVLNGDRDAFAELYDRRARLVRAVCHDETGDPDAAADLTQEVFLRAYRNLARLRNPAQFASWVIGMARQVCREQRRSDGRERRRRAGWAELHKSDMLTLPPPDDRLVRLRNAIAGSSANGDQAGRALTDEQRMALHAFYLQGRSVEEARSVLGLSRSGFYRVMSRACERLRRVFESSEVTP